MGGVGVKVQRAVRDEHLAEEPIVGFAGVGGRGFRVQGLGDEAEIFDPS